MESPGEERLSDGFSELTRNEINSRGKTQATVGSNTLWVGCPELFKSREMVLSTNKQVSTHTLPSAFDCGCDVGISFRFLLP